MSFAIVSLRRCASVRGFWKISPDTIPEPPRTFTPVLSCLGQKTCKSCSIATAMAAILRRMQQLFMAWEVRARSPANAISTCCMYTCFFQKYASHITLDPVPPRFSLREPPDFHLLARSLIFNILSWPILVTRCKFSCCHEQLDFV